MDEAHAQGCSFEWDIDALFAAVEKEKNKHPNWRFYAACFREKEFILKN